MKFDILFTTVVHCLLQSFGTYGFNIDVGNAIIFDGPPKSEYFGYSVALHSSPSGYWAIVGAPLSNVTSQSGSETFARYGAAYRCGYPNGQCNIINIDNKPIWRDEISPGQWIDMEQKTGQWLGGTVYSTGSKALVCAPRYIFRGRPGNEGIHFSWLQGKCFTLTPDLSAVQSDRLDPCAGELQGNNHYGYCEAGFSAEFSADGYDVILGVVGAKRGKGGIMLYTDNNYNTYYKSPQDQIDFDSYMGYAVSSGKFADNPKTEYIGGAPKADNFKGKALVYDLSDRQLLARSLPQPKNLPTGTYFGSAICAVDLDNNEFSDILIGAPYFTLVKDEGRVYIYINNGQGALNLQDSYLEGDKKVNAHFGQAIASVGDLNRDGFNDVAIGAPMEGEDGSGAVYIYHGSDKGIELQYRQKILGSKVKAGLKMFGISISGGVDVDKNEYPDIAVGAYGSENAVIMRSQSIVNVKGDIKLSKQQISLESNDSICDLEGAKHKCLNLTLVFSYDDKIQKTASKDLNIKYTVELDKNKDRGLRRMFFWDAVNKKRLSVLEENYTIAVRQTDYTLPPKTVYLVDKDEVGDVSSLLTFDLSFSQPQPPCNDLCPVLNAYMATSYRIEVPFKKKCRNQVACVPDLSLSGNLEFSPKEATELRIGIVKDFTVQLTVANNAEDSAYTSKIKLKHPDTLDYVGPDKGIECDRSSSDNRTTTVTCDVGNPLQGKSSMSFGIKFSPGTVKENFVIEVVALSQDKDSDDQDNKKRFPIAVKFEADVEITGSSKQDQVVYSGPVRDEEEVKRSLDSIGPEVIQTLSFSRVSPGNQPLTKKPGDSGIDLEDSTTEKGKKKRLLCSLSIRNKGPSAVDGSEVTVNFPNLYSSERSDSYLLYLLHVELDGAAGSCNAKVNPLDIQAPNDTTEEDNKQSRKRRDTEENMLLGCRQASCKSFQCSLGLLKLGDKVEIKMTFRLWQNTLLKELETPKAVDLETWAKVKVPGIFTQPNKDNDETTIITTAKPAQTKAQEKKTPWWVIFLSVLGGVLLLVGAVAVLYKLGFFKRKRIKDISGPMEENVPMNTK